MPFTIEEFLGVFESYNAANDARIPGNRELHLE